MRTAARIAARMDCDAVVQVGDFWLLDGSSPVWPPLSRARWEVDPPPWPEVMWWAVTSQIPVIVVDGNHEVWPCLDRYQQRTDVIESRRQGQPLHLGGAVSPDKEWASPAYRWPASEAPTSRDQQRLLANAPAGLDVLFTHDAPSGV